MSGTYNGKTEEEWLALARCFFGNTEVAEQVGRKAFAARSSLWHAATLVWREAVVERNHRCDVCNGLMSEVRLERHELCRFRKQRGLPTPTIDDPMECSCGQCREEVAS